WVISSPAIADGLAMVGNSDDKLFEGIDIASGQRRWKVDLKARVFGSGSVVGGIVYVGDQEGRVHALDVATGAERWRLQLPSGVNATPVPADGLLLVGCDDGMLYALESSPAAPQTPRAVYRDPAAPEKYFTGGAALAEALQRQGYQTLDTAGLLAFLATRPAGQSPGVVVFATDLLPDAVAADDAKALRSFMEAGGRIVWVGLTPLLLKLDPATQKIAAITPERTDRLLGKGQGDARTDSSTSTPTDEGWRWGLRHWRLASQGVDPGSVDTVLALNENGLATAWVKRFGAEGSFVRVWGAPDPYPDPAEIDALATHRLE
ncbi:MAG TPA: PQQ-binding-like beta-propeller repeat protein, partial [Stellaceae bacterium]|nr:PQQ-binding-like beta-propeller repeat protein [Stellaceae bacterium]